MPNTMFALDIGTRSVTGILLEMEESTYQVLDYVEIEHTERSMRDGQIHHVVAVAEVIKQVKQLLEERNSLTLYKACVAAAGRSLKTTKAKATITLNNQPITKQEEIKHMELLAVQEAQRQLIMEEKQDTIKHYCVGYSVLKYQLDNEDIGSFIDQQGDAATVHIIATFLPKVVVESLLAALQRAELEMEALTLEPIAAIQVLIPESMRRLNVALVDIGAGTSDIALTDQGTVIAYGMVPVAGDEITEAISDHYLLDFPKAEQMKRQIVSEGEAQIEDILGFETIVTYNQCVEDINSSIHRLSDQITEEILRLNEKVPRAIMLVGGGSLTPELSNKIAAKLDLPENRVAIRGIEAIANLKKKDHTPKGPAFVTPIGIAIAASQNPVHYVTVTVNKKRIRMFEMKKLTVGDCIIQSGIDTNKLYGKSGTGIVINVNGKDMVIPGSIGQPPIIYVNSVISSIDDFIKNGDSIEVQTGAPGSSPHLQLNEIIEPPNLTFYHENEMITLPAKILVNGKVRSSDYIIQDQDDIEWKEKLTVQDFIDLKSIPIKDSFYVYVNNRQYTIQEAETTIHINGRKVSTETILSNMDKLEISTIISPTVDDLLTQLDLQKEQTCKIMFNDSPVVLTQSIALLYRNSEQLATDALLYEGDHIQLTEEVPKPFIFQDVFRYISLDIYNLDPGFKIYRNEQLASFDEIIQPGDRLEIK
ncbi:cell division protein FtsA [Oceanobacillus sp. 1P07AA]|uniref:cell division protein FtsA n=1 Tax=Oceanobacillus sp. 1P07AA TaxID=3132293 RepID=UPI0039A6D9C2